MRSVFTEAIILDVVDLQERDRIVTLLTRRYGKKRGVARGARRKYSRFAGQLQPLAKVRVRWFEKEGRDLVRIGEVDLVRPAHRLQQDLDDIMLGSYLAEHLTEFVQEDEESELPFRLLESTLEALLDGVDRDLAARYFEIWMLRLAGIFPSARECPVCGRPLAGGAILPAGGDALVCPECAGGEATAGGGGGGGARFGDSFVARPELVELLGRIERQRLPDLAATPPPAALLAQTRELAARLRRRFLDRELRSYRVMERVRSETGGG